MPTPNEQLAALTRQLEAMRAENAALKQKSNSPLTMKVSEKGAVSVYGLGRFPVTLYAEQWTKLLATAKAIESFIEVNHAKLPTKAEKQAQAPVPAPKPSNGAL